MAESERVLCLYCERPISSWGKDHLGFFHTVYNQKCYNGFKAKIVSGQSRALADAAPRGTLDVATEDEC